MRSLFLTRDGHILGIKPINEDFPYRYKVLETESCPCIDAVCSLTMTYTDVNRCEDDAFNVYALKNDGTEDFLFLVDMVSSPAGCCGTSSGGAECPQTTITKEVKVDKDYVDSCGKLHLRLELDHLNCCATYATWAISGPYGGRDEQSFSGPSTISFDVAKACGNGTPP